MAPLEPVIVTSDVRDRFIAHLQASFGADSEAFSRPDTDDPDVFAFEKQRIAVSGGLGAHQR